MKKIIGIVSRPTVSKSERNMLGVYESYIRCIIKAGGIPLIISPTQNIAYEKYNRHVLLKDEEKENLITILKLCDGFLLPGGSDIYEYDYIILEYALKHDIPVLGICLGLQIMASFGNYNLIPVYNHDMVNHKVTISKDSTLYKIFKKEVLYVNSRHKEQVKNSGIYKVVARSDDEVIEAIELDSNTFNLGIQWHPENLEDEQILFNYFLKQIKKQ